MQKWNEPSCYLTCFAQNDVCILLWHLKVTQISSKFVEALMNLNGYLPLSKYVLSLGFTAEPILCTTEIWQWKKLLWPSFYLLKKSVVLIFFNGVLGKNFPNHSMSSMNLYAFSAEYGKMFIPLLLICRDFQASTGGCHPTSNASFTWAWGIFIHNAL